jgi:hypothetical protein
LEEIQNLDRRVATPSFDRINGNVIQLFNAVMRIDGAKDLGDIRLYRGPFQFFDFSLAPSSTRTGSLDVLSILFGLITRHQSSG